jgi:type IV secretion system protein VirB8
MTAPMTREELVTYYEQAGSWAEDRINDTTRSRKIAWIVAIIAALIALAEAVALMVLTPMKTVVPYTLLVDRQTGHVQTLNPLETDRIAPDAALTQSFLVQYVLAREGFSFSSVQADYKKVALWSAEGARSDYVAGMQVSNPESPLTRVPRSSTVEARVRSVSALGKGSSLIRFETTRRDKGGAPQATQSWVALITYRFSNAPMSIEERYINPLGFQVVRYARNAETPPTSEAALDANTGAATGQPPNSLMQPIGTPTPRPASATGVVR